MTKMEWSVHGGHGSPFAILASKEDKKTHMRAFTLQNLVSVQKAGNGRDFADQPRTGFLSFDNTTYSDYPTAMHNYFQNYIWGSLLA